MLWCAHERTGNTAPIDAEPSPTGNLMVNEATGTYRVLAGDRLDAARALKEPLHLNHFVTCPTAKRWSR